MRLAVLQSNYIPWKGYFDLMAMADLFVVYDSVQYTKNDWRNRNLLPSPTGPTWLTIPVDTAGRADQRINEAAIGDRRWARKHWQTVSQLLARRPAFAPYRDAWQSWWARSRVVRIAARCQCLISFGDWPNSSASTRRSSTTAQYQLSTDTPTGKLVQLCQQVGADRYVTGPAGLNYLELAAVRRGRRRCRRDRLRAYPTYEQTTDEFHHGVSVLDLLASVGPAARTHLLGRFRTVTA